MKTMKLFAICLLAGSVGAFAQNAGGPTEKNGTVTVPLNGFNRLNERVLFQINRVTWDIDFYDSDYFVCQNETELRKKASDFLNLNPDDFVHLSYLNGSAAIGKWGARNGILMADIGEDSFISQFEVSGKEPEEGDVILLEVKDENGPLDATVVLPGNGRQLYRHLGSTDENGRLAFSLDDTGDHILVQCPGYHGVYQAIRGTGIEITMKRNPYLNETDVELGRRNLVRSADNYGDRKSEINISGDKPKAGDVISGTLLADGAPVVGCMVAEIGADGRIVSRTQTDEDGNFSLAIKNPDNFLFMGYDVIRYDFRVRLVEISGSSYQVNLAPRMFLRG